MSISGVNDINPSPSPESMNSGRARTQQQTNVEKLNRAAKAETQRESLSDDLEELTEEELEEGIETLNESVQALHKSLKFELHEESDRMQVQVIDVIEDEVLKELPPEEVLDMLGRIRQMVGLIIDERI